MSGIDTSPIDGHTPINIWGRMRETARLSRRGKALLLGLIALITAAILIGVMTAGGHNKSQKSQNTVATSASAGVGITAPPAPKKEDPASSGSALQVRPTSVASADAKDASSKSDNKAAASALDKEDQEFQLWLKKHRLDRIRGEIIASDAALTAEVLKSGGAVATPVVAHVKTENEDPVAQVTAARRAALAGLPQSLQAGQPGGAAYRGLAGVAGEAGVSQATHKAFLAEAGNPIYLGERVQPRIGQHELVAGSVIPAVLLTAVNSDLPGVLSAQVRQTVYDTHNPAVVVIPQGSRLIGRYSSDVGYAQERVLVAWDSLVFPNGASIDLKGMLGTDGQGQSGFQDQVDKHFFRTWGSAFLISMLGVGVQLSQPQNSGAFNTPSTSSQAAGAVANSMNEAGSKVLSKNLGLAPTLQIRPGYTFNVMVNRSIVMPAYR